MQKVLKQYKRIKRDHVFVELIPLDIPETVFPPVSFYESPVSEPSDWEEMEEPLNLTTMTVSLPNLALNPIPIVQFKPDPVISFNDTPAVSLPRWELNEPQKPELMPMELPMICPRISHRAKPVELHPIPISLTKLRSGRFSFQIEEPEVALGKVERLFTQVDLSFLKTEVDNDLKVFMELPIINIKVSSVEPPQMDLKEIPLPSNSTKSHLLRQTATEINQSLKQALFRNAPCEYNEFLIELPSIEEAIRFFPDEFDDIELQETIGIEPIAEFNNIELALLPWDYFKALIVVLSQELVPYGVTEEKPDVSQSSLDLMQSLSEETTIQVAPLHLPAEQENFIISFEWIAENNGDPSLSIPESSFSALGSIHQFMFLKGKADKVSSTPTQVVQESVPLQYEGPTTTVVDPLVDLYHKFSLEEQPTYKCIISADLFKRTQLVRSLERLRFDLVERDLICPSLILDCNNIILYYPFRKLIKTENIGDMVKSELGQMILSHCLKYSTVHVVFESVQPQQDPTKLRVYPFTPPVIKSLELLHQIHYSIMSPTFQSTLQIWYSDTCEHSAWVTRSIGKGIHEQTVNPDLWLARQWISEEATTVFQAYVARRLLISVPWIKSL